LNANDNNRPVGFENLDAFSIFNHIYMVKFWNIFRSESPFPEKIVLLPVLQTTNEGDLVLEPFCGSMTIGNVSVKI
jgi:DNA modification methylase